MTVRYITKATYMHFVNTNSFQGRKVLYGSMFELWMIGHSFMIQNHEPNFNNVSPFVYHLPNLHFNCEVVKQYFRISNVVRGPTLYKLFHGRFRNVTTIYFIYSQTHMGDMSLDGGADWMRPSDPLPLVTTYVRSEERSIKSSTILPQLLCQTNV